GPPQRLFRPLECRRGRGRRGRRIDRSSCFQCHETSLIGCRSAQLPSPPRYFEEGKGGSMWILRGDTENRQRRFASGTIQRSSTSEETDDKIHRVHCGGVR